jgi:hypothetical protein
VAPANAFDDIPVLTELPRENAVAKLQELDEHEVAEEVAAGAAGTYTKDEYQSALSRSLFRQRLWLFTAHAVGYLAPASGSEDLIPIRHAGAISPDLSLRDSRLKLTIDRLRVADYPGGGTHRVLLGVGVHNQAASPGQNLHFVATYQVREGGSAGVAGYPIFLGLSVGRDGLVLDVITVNVSNQADERFLGVLESEVFKAGLKLVEGWQPALAPLSELALGLIKTIAARTRNIAVQKFTLGLDFGSSPVGLRLAEGAYVAVQIPDSLELMWDWSGWGYDPLRGQLVSRANPVQPIPYNYVVLGISRVGDALP